MKTIHKYPLRLDDQQMIAVPSGAKALSVQLQRTGRFDHQKQPVLWMEVDDAQVETLYRVTIVGTGREIPSSVKSEHYVATVQWDAMVWHFYVQRVE